MRLGRCSNGNKPWLPIDVGKLRDQLERAITRVLPDGLRFAEREFLDRAIVGAGRTGIAVADIAAVGLLGIAAANADMAVICLLNKTKPQRIARQSSCCRSSPRQTHAGEGIGLFRDHRNAAPTEVRKLKLESYSPSPVSPPPGHRQICHPAKPGGRPVASRWQPGSNPVPARCAPEAHPVATRCAPEPHPVWLGRTSPPARSAAAVTLR